jgi:hypothetical protein
VPRSQFLTHCGTLELVNYMCEEKRNYVSGRYRDSPHLPAPLLRTQAVLQFSAGIFKQSMGARNRVRIGLPYQPAWLQSLAELVPWNRFLGSLKV